MSHYSYLSLFLIFSVFGFIKLTYANLRAEGTGCECEKLSCGCCLFIKLPEVGLNDTACVNITYLPDEYGIHFTLNIDKIYIYNETISARSPPPICAGAPFLEEFAEVCIHFYDLDASLSKLHGCVDLEGRLRTIVVARYNLGCFNIGETSSNFKKMEQHHLNVIDRIRSFIGR